MKTHPIALQLSAFALMLTAFPAIHAGKAHEHGAAKLEVAIEGGKLTVALQSPLDSLLGFERAPRTDAERKAAVELLARLRSGDTLFAPDKAAQCTLSQAEVTAPLLDVVGKAPVAQAAAGEHADLAATYRFNCAQPQQLRTLELGLFDAFKRMQRIDVQVAGAQGQRKATLKRPARTVKLGQ